MMTWKPQSEGGAVISLGSRTQGVTAKKVQRARILIEVGEQGERVDNDETITQKKG
ncbi:MAG: hypothetical protein ACJ8EL_13805 [Rhizomicrobium sp.]